MSVYLIAELSIHDRDTYAKYESEFMDILTAYAGKIISVDEAPEVLEGAWSADRSVVLRFDSQQAALGWYHSDAYQAIANHRKAASTGNIRMVNAF